MTSLLDFDSNPELRYGNQLVIVPFGEYFLLDLGERVVRLSQSGEVLDAYELPDKWRDKDYRVMLYVH